MKKITSIILFLLIGFSLSAQEEKTNPFLQNIEVGSLIGAELSRNTGDFKFAYALRYTGSYQISPQFSLGGGLGFEKYNDISLIPIFLDAHAYLKPQINSPYFSFQMGYAPGWHAAYQQLDDYEFKGGIFMGFDYGRRVSIKDDLTFNIAIGLKFQNTALEIENIYLDDYKEDINFLLLNLKVGFGF